MDSKEFSTKIRKAATNKEFEITDSSTSKKFWRWLKKNKWLNLGQSITEKEAGLIIKGINLYYKECLLNGKDVRLPHRMGGISVRKIKNEVKFKNGKLLIPYHINWKDTLDMWFEDEEARQEKVLIRYEVPYLFKIYYNFSIGVFENKRFYMFKPARSLKLSLKNKIKTEEFDALPKINKDGIY